MVHDSEYINKITLEGREIGPGNKVFIIAEAGVNHNGDLEIAKKMVDAAAECGADCIKFQTFRTEEFLADRKSDYSYESRGENIKENMFEMFKRLELPPAWHKELFDRARRRGLIPLTSVADIISADLAESCGAKAFKLSSEDLINLPLVENIAARDLPIIFSTGMADEEEIRDALNILAKAKHRQAAFLHCVSLYPTPDEDANLKRITTLRAITRGVVGYSDHTLGSEAALGAVAIGASILEKHFTLDRNMPGPDHSFSADPGELKRLAENVRQLEKMLGNGAIEPSGMQLEIRKSFRRSLAAASDLPEGWVVRREDLTLKRPGTGLRARDINLILGKKLKRHVAGDEIITPDMVE